MFCAFWSFTKSLMPSQVAFREHTGLNSQHFYLLLPVFLTVGTTADGGIKVQKFRTKKFFASHTSQSKQQKKQRFHRKSSGKWKYLRWHTNVWSTLQQPKHLRMSQTGLEHLWEEAGFNGIWKWHYSEMIAEAEKIIITFEKFSSSRLPVLGSTVI